MSEDLMFHTARPVSRGEFDELAARHRRELQVHCYRMLGSLQDAEDLVQETLLRAWQKLDTYEGRASFRAWLYKIATNACLNALNRRPRRTLPQARQPASDPSQPLAPPIDEPIWLEPIPDELIAGIESSPEARHDAHESITLAFLAALQVLPPRQRAVLLLRDVLDMHADEVAHLLDMTVSAVNSVLNRARTTLAKHYATRGMESVQAEPGDKKMRELLDRYMRAWEDADVDALVLLLKEDATLDMPPIPGWFQGKPAIAMVFSTIILAGDARGRYRMLPTRANGEPAFAWYQRDEASGAMKAFAIQVAKYDGVLIADTTIFAYPALFKYFGLAPELKA